jgi:hypothetical protein
MDNIKNIKKNEYSTSHFDNFLKIFDGNVDNKIWQNINSFLIGFKIGSTDLTRFLKFVLFKDNYKTMYLLMLRKC